jgi:hypothetical protein
MPSKPKIEEGEILAQIMPEKYPAPALLAQTFTTPFYVISNF